MEACPSCGHPWLEHPGGTSAPGHPETCGECVYEIEHGESEAGTSCELRVPDEVLARAAPVNSHE